MDQYLVSLVKWISNKPNSFFSLFFFFPYSINALVDQEVKRRLFEEKLEREKQRKMEREKERQEREKEIHKLRSMHERELRQLRAKLENR